MRASIAFILPREIFPTSIALPTAAAGSRPQPHRRLRWWRRGCDWTATKKSSFGAAINDAVRLVSSPAAVLVHVDARFYLRGRKGGRRERGREGERDRGSERDSGCFKCVGFICRQSLRNHHHSRFSSPHTGWDRGYIV